jgi:hypothetical protein
VNDQKCSQPRIRGLTSGGPAGDVSTVAALTPWRLRHHDAPRVSRA